MRLFIISTNQSSRVRSMRTFSDSFSAFICSADQPAPEPSAVDRASASILRACARHSSPSSALIVSSASPDLPHSGRAVVERRAAGQHRFVDGERTLDHVFEHRHVVAVVRDRRGFGRRSSSARIDSRSPSSEFCVSLSRVDGFGFFISGLRKGRSRDETEDSLCRDSICSDRVRLRATTARRSRRLVRSGRRTSESPPRG